MTGSTQTTSGARPDSERLTAQLKRPQAYAHAPREVGFLETHISLLFFAGERVYKVKKSVDLGFLDFTSLAGRRHFCDEEVRLNRRLAPEVYLGVVPIVQGADGHLRVGSAADEDAALEWAVEMVRLPERRMLSSLLERGEIDNEQMNDMARLLARFHAEAPTGPGVDEHGSPDAIRANVEENLAQLGEFKGEPGSVPAGGVRVITSVQHAFLRARRSECLERHHDLLERRVREGRIREGHGDLHAGNICITEAGVVAYDCIEFNRRFRCADVALDLAFLAMDIDYRGFPSFSRYLVRRYAEESGDEELALLESFYKGYRAIVRGKVTALMASNPALSTDRREELRREAMRYVQLAAAYELPPAMILMCGLPACGKTWLARRLAGSLRAIVLQSDVRRKILTRIAPTDRVREEFDAGLYSPEMKTRTYRSLLADALKHLRRGHSVIVDATFSSREFRSSFIDAAARLELPYYVLHVSASDEVTRARLASREHETGVASDADLAIYLRAREKFEPPSEVPAGHVLETLSGAGSPEEESSLVIDGMIALQCATPSV